MPVETVALTPGFLVITNDRGRKHQIAVTDVLRAADVPDLNIDSLTLLTKLAQVVTVLVKTLVEQNILDETLVEGYDLSYVADTLIDDLAVEW